jgi:hypothetical protein
MYRATINAAYQCPCASKDKAYPIARPRMRSRASWRSRARVRGGADVVTGLDLNGAVGAGDPDELADRPAGPVFCPAVDGQCGAGRDP